MGLFVGDQPDVFSPLAIGITRVNAGFEFDALPLAELVELSIFHGAAVEEDVAGGSIRADEPETPVVANTPNSSLCHVGRPFCCAFTLYDFTTDYCIVEWG